MPKLPGSILAETVPPPEDKAPEPRTQAGSWERRLKSPPPPPQALPLRSHPSSKKPRQLRRRRRARTVLPRFSSVSPPPFVRKSSLDPMLWEAFVFLPLLTADPRTLLPGLRQRRGIR